MLRLQRPRHALGRSEPVLRYAFAIFGNGREVHRLGPCYQLVSPLCAPQFHGDGVTERFPKASIMYSHTNCCRWDLSMRWVGLESSCCGAVSQYLPTCTSEHTSSVLLGALCKLGSHLAKISHFLIKLQRISCLVLRTWQWLLPVPAWRS